MTEPLTVATMQKQSHALSREKGWWDGIDSATPRVVPEKLMLVVSEVAEALESYRKGEPLSFVDCPEPGCYVTHRVGAASCVAHSFPLKPEGLASELADVVIRCGDLAGFLGIDLERAISEKHAYNATRPQRHGGKVC
jgi:NTP pyrophosphatase (non-canonical NTP hydrolase)